MRSSFLQCLSTASKFWLEIQGFIKPDYNNFLLFYPVFYCCFLPVFPFFRFLVVLFCFIPFFNRYFTFKIKKSKIRFFQPLYNNFCSFFNVLYSFFVVFYRFFLYSVFYRSFLFYTVFNRYLTFKIKKSKNSFFNPFLTIVINF